VSSLRPGVRDGPLAARAQDLGLCRLRRDARMLEPCRRPALST
jgi:hypothetical protein